MPYTIGLLASLPRLDARKDSALAALEGNPPSLLAEPTGCPFAPRCPIAQDECLDGEPALTAVRDADDALSDACGPPSAGVQLSACRAAAPARSRRATSMAPPSTPCRPSKPPTP